MKKITTILKNIALTAFILGSLIACDIDFASIDSDVINPDNAKNFSTNVEEYSIITYNKNIGPVQTNSLSSYLLGYYNDPVYGTSISNFVSQISPTTFDPSFGENIVLDSVILTIPYFSRLIETDADGNSIYETDSIFGDTPIKLSVYKNDYFLRDFDPDSEFNEPQKYFSNGSTFLEGELLYQDNQFLPNENQIVLTVIDPDTDLPIESGRLAPSIRVKLDIQNDTFWEELIFNKEGEPELSNQNNFIDHFRGLYLKTEATDLNGTMMMLNFTSTDAHITLYYTSDIEISDSDTETTQEEGTFVLSFGGNQINLFDNNFITIPDGDEINGDEKLYLKGGDGSMAIINLFDGDAEGNSTEFEEFKNNYNENGTIKRLINEAYLEFYVDQTTMQGKEPERVFIYDLNNNIPLADYVFDQSISETTTKLDHLVPLKRENDEFDGQGIKYKIRITEHIKNLAIRDSTNVKLGLVVTTNVSSITALDLQNSDPLLSVIPSGAVLSHRGTVLHGNQSINDDKKVTFKIYYTEPNN
ncbi:MAG: DUF4270 domain-containing protein [Bacteroidetes bacterium]|nr:DUF4270 domain-containing protein [Bacteroidota bacterium]